MIILENEDGGGGIRVLKGENEIENGYLETGW